MWTTWHAHVPRRFAKAKGSEAMAKEVAKRRSSAPVQKQSAAAAALKQAKTPGPEAAGGRGEITDALACI